MTARRGLAIALLLAACGPQAIGQELKPWKHGVIEPKGDAGFMVMVGQRDFAEALWPQDRNRSAEERRHRSQGAARRRT